MWRTVIEARSMIKLAMAEHSSYTVVWISEGYLGVDTLISLIRSRPRTKAKFFWIYRRRFVVLSWTVYALRTIKPGNRARLSTPVAPVYYLCGANSSCKNFIFNLVAGESFLPGIRQIYKPSIKKMEKAPLYHSHHPRFISIDWDGIFICQLLELNFI